VAVVSLPQALLSGKTLYCLKSAQWRNTA